MILVVPILIVAFLAPLRIPVHSRPQEVRQIPPRTPAQQEAVHELNATARLYREGKYAEAQKHAEKALALDPSSRVAPSFLARTIHAQYLPGVYSEANYEKAREAIEAYKVVLARDPKADEAYKAVAYLYNATKDDELFREWVHRRALDSTVSDEKRAEAFIVLASKDWDCAFKITELPTSKLTDLVNGFAKLQYIKPTDITEFDKALKCSTRGLEMIDTAVTLRPNSESAWTYKIHLLEELAKLAEMDKNLPLKLGYERQIETARTTRDTIVKSQAVEASPEP